LELSINVSQRGVVLQQRLIDLRQPLQDRRIRRHVLS
jgi:hypothetical protein